MIDGRRPQPAVAGAVWAALFWAAAVGIAVALRPALPVDETRYLAVAWDMWLRGDFLVPHLNGEPYSHKPPLLFWLIHLGWALFGVVEWWPKLVAPLFALATLLAVRALARALWPDQPATAETAPLVLWGSGYFALFATLTMFDMLVAALAAAGLLAVVRAARAGEPRGLAWLGLALGLGLLAKGPAVFLHVLPAALLAPLWRGALRGPAAPPIAWRRWYAALGFSVLGGFAIVLAWAVPAAVSGGETFRHEIFWGQTAGRMVEAFDHAEPWWWYFAALPALWLPLLAWPAAWRAIAGLPGAWRDGGIRLCAIWFAVAFATFSAISGKQPHYLLPAFGALALLLAHRLPDEAPPGRAPLQLPGLAVALAGVALLALALPPVAARLGGWLPAIAPAWGAVPLALGLAVAALPQLAVRTQALVVAFLSTLLVLTAHAAVRPALRLAFDLRPFAETLKALEADDRPIAHYGKYHGQYHFLGRLERPFASIGDTSAADWIAANPNGVAITYRRIADPLPPGPAPLASGRFRNRLALVWDGEAIRGNPRLLRLPSGDAE